MPELPEVETVCRTLGPLLTGHNIVSSEFLWARTLSTPPEIFATRVTNKPITGVTRRAKLIRVELDDGCVMTVHLRMTGELLWLPPGSEPAPDRLPYLRAEFLLDDGSSLFFFDTRKFGRIAGLDLGGSRQLDEYFGIEPLSQKFTADWLHEQLQKRKRQIKPLLLDQTFVAGLGNIYVDESLYLAGIHPLTRSDMITPEQAAALRDAIVNVLEGALSRRGTTLRDYRSGLGEPGENQQRLLVYGAKPGSLCVKCGTELERIVVGQRGTTFCPRCQPAPMPVGTPNR